MILRNEFISENIKEKGLLLDSLDKYFILNKDTDDNITLKNIPKSDFNDSSVENKYDDVATYPLEDFEEIIEEEIFDNKYAMIWKNTSNEYFFFYYNTISEEIKEGEILNANEIKTVNFKLVDDNDIYFNYVGLDGDDLFITEDVIIENDDVALNIIDIDDITILAEDIDITKDYDILLNNLNTILLKQDTTMYSIIVDEMSANIDNIILDKNYKSEKVNLAIGETEADGNLFYDFVCYDDLRLEDNSNNISGYALNYLDRVDGEFNSYGLYKLFIPLFEDNYNIDYLDPIYYINDSGEETHLPSYPTDGDYLDFTDTENYFTVLDNTLVYPNHIKTYFNRDKDFDLVQSYNLNISYSYIDDNVDELELDKLDIYTNNTRNNNQIHFYKNYIQSYNDLKNMYNKFVILNNDDINEDVLFVNLTKLFPLKMQENEQMKKIIDAMNTIYNGGMKDLTNGDNINVLFNNIGKHYTDDKKLFFLYKNNLDVWFYDKSNLLFGDNIFKFIESLDKYKSMDKIPYEDIFTFAKSFGIGYIINEDIMTHLEKSNNITEPNITVNKIGNFQSDELFVRNALKVLRQLSKYRGSTNFYEMILSVMGFAIDIDMQILNKKNRVNDSNIFESLTNNVTIEIDSNYFKNKSDYISDILTYMTKLIRDTLYLNRSFIGITYKNNYIINNKLSTEIKEEIYQQYDEVTIE